MKDLNKTLSQAANLLLSSSELSTSGKLFTEESKGKSDIKVADLKNVFGKAGKAEKLSMLGAGMKEAAARKGAAVHWLLADEIGLDKEKAVNFIRTIYSMMDAQDIRRQQRKAVKMTLARAFEAIHTDHDNEGRTWELVDKTWEVSRAGATIIKAVKVKITEKDGAPLTVSLVDSKEVHWTVENKAILVKLGKLLASHDVFDVVGASLVAVDHATTKVAVDKATVALQAANAKLTTEQAREDEKASYKANMMEKGLAAVIG